MQTESTSTLRSSSISRGDMILRKLRTAMAPRLRWYSTTDYLPVRNFYMRVKTGDLRWILKLEDYEHLPDYSLDLNKAWEKIWNEFIEISNNRDYQIYFQTLRKYIKVLDRYEILKAEIFTLYFRFKKEYADDLEEEGILLNMDTRESYIESLDTAGNRIENLNTKIQILTKELEAKSKTDKTNFEDLVYSVEVYQGFPIDIDKLSIRKFVLMLNKINDNGKRQN